MDRCNWCTNNLILQNYHDNEWGDIVHDDKKHFEYLLMEVMQCGLNWLMILQKREILRTCFDNFDYNIIARYDENDIERIIKTDGMIKSKRKIEAIINNAKCFLEIRDKFTSFDSYLWSFSNYKTLIYIKHQKGFWENHNDLSDRISSDMKRKGFKYLGSITIFSHLQACGIINDHAINCYKYNQIIERGNIEYVYQ